MMVQYLLPVLIVSVAYARVAKRIKTRVAKRQTMTSDSLKSYKMSRQTQKTNALLVMIAIIFGISWLPLNILNIICDFFYPFENNQVYRIVFAVCHMFAMSSACSNPILYGWFNNNFKTEFRELFQIAARCLPAFIFRRTELSRTSSKTQSTRCFRSTIEFSQISTAADRTDAAGTTNGSDNSKSTNGEPFAIKNLD